MSFAIANATIFDDTRLFPHSTVVVLEDRRIAALLQSVPFGVTVDDATGATLLRDSSIHTFLDRTRFGNAQGYK